MSLHSIRIAKSCLAVAVALAGCGGGSSSTRPDAADPSAQMRQALVGTWSTEGCENAGPAGWVQKRFDIDASAFTVTVNVFGDEACTAPTLRFTVHGTPEVIGRSSVGEDVWEVDYVMDRRELTPLAEPVAMALGGAACAGRSDWAVGAPVDVTIPGCPAFGIEPNPPCDREHDLNALRGDRLFFGDRSSSLCAARPAALAATPVVRR